MNMDTLVIAIILEAGISKMDIIARITGDDTSTFDEKAASLDGSFPASVYEKIELYDEIVYRVRPSLLNPASIRDLREEIYERCETESLRYFDQFDIAKTEKLFFEESDSQHLIKRIQHQVCRNLKWVSTIPGIIYLGNNNDPVRVRFSGIQVQAISHFTTEESGKSEVFTNLICNALTHPLRELVGAYIIRPDQYR